MCKLVKDYIKKTKERRYNIENAIKIMKEYCEGGISPVDFYMLFKENKYIQELVISDKKVNDDVHKYNKKKLESINLNCINDRMELFCLTANYFRRRKVKLNYFNPDGELFDFILSICPK